MMGWVECSVLFHPTFFCSTLVLALLLSLYVHFFGYSGLSFGWNSFSVCLCTFDAWVKMVVSFGWDCSCFRSIYSFRYSFFSAAAVAFHFNVISLSRWKIFMANGSVFYTQRVVIAKSCSKQITSTNSKMGLCCLCIFFVSLFLSVSVSYCIFFNQTILSECVLNIIQQKKFNWTNVSDSLVFFCCCSNWLCMDRKSFEHKKPIKICKVNFLWDPKPLTSVQPKWAPCTFFRETWK